MTNQKIINEVEGWTRPPAGMPALAVTLTHPHNTPDNDRIKQVKKLQSVLNRRAFGGSAKPGRGEKRLYFFMMTEKGFEHQETYMHHHGIIEIPPTLNEDDWIEIVISEWIDISSGDRKSQKVNRLDGPAFHKYMLKRRDKAIFTDAIRTEAICLQSEFHLAK